jgi:flavin-dependent dehydrogenase
VQHAFDVAVIGAGPAGSAAARCLASTGCRVLLAERTRFESRRVGESLGPEAQPQLTALGVWERFLATGPVPSWETRSLWGDETPRAYSHLLSPYGCAWHVDRARFDRMLAAAAVEAGAALREGTALAACRDDGTRWQLVLVGREATMEASARILVDATGRGARIARRLGARRRVFDALIGSTAWLLGADTSEQGFTLLEAEAGGWWYSAPAGMREMVAMLATDGDLAGRGRLHALTGWRARLAAAPVTAGRIDAMEVVDGPRVFSAASHRLHRAQDRGRWLAVGDAALAVDPISGSGVPRALRTARLGAEAVLAMLEGGRSDALTSYEADCDQECDEYLQQRAWYYCAEERWACEPFWARRRDAPAPG